MTRPDDTSTLPGPDRAATIMMMVGAVGLGAFLLFLLQPLWGRALLPRFGGVPAVWAAALACYQTFLFVGYLLAHVLRTRLGARGQGLALTGLLVVGAASLPLLPSPPTGHPDDPAAALVMALLLGAGPVFVPLAVAGPLLQHWAGGTQGGRATYRLYAVSNAASLAALILYPTVFERVLDLGAVGRTWDALYVVMIVLVGVIAWRRRRVGAASTAETASSRPPGPVTATIWAAWAAAGVIVLNAVTTLLAQEFASVPLLWTVPLALYLITWIVAFSGRPSIGPRAAAVLAAIALGALTLALGGGSARAVPLRLALLLGSLVAAGLAAHGALYRGRPDTVHLTRFYLVVAGGGALGGIVSGLAAPLAGPRWTETAIGFGLIAVLAAATRVRDLEPSARPGERRAAVAVAVLLLLLGVRAAVLVWAGAPGAVHVSRDFHGLMSVIVADDDDPARRRLVLRHGGTTHGSQFTAPERRGEPTTYYGRDTGCGVATSVARDLAGEGRGLEIGAVGLGAGTLAALTRPGDGLRFYELSPAVVAAARGEIDTGGTGFSYLRDAEAEVSVVVGDARVSLARELAATPAGRGFDLLVMDAFAGDAVPVHLLTREAFDVYLAHLAPRGIMAIHISSNWIDLRPPVYAWARDAGWRALTIVNRADTRDGLLISTWVLLLRDLDGLSSLRDHAQPLMASGTLQVENMSEVAIDDFTAWTDARGGVLDVLLSRIRARR